MKDILIRFARHEPYSKLTVRQIAIVAAVSESCTGVKEIADALDISKPSVTRNKAKMIEQGYLVQKSHPDDRRQVILKRTAKGEKLLKEMEA